MSHTSSRSPATSASPMTTSRRTGRAGSAGLPRASTSTCERIGRARRERYVRTLGAVSERAVDTLFEWPPTLFARAKVAASPGVSLGVLDGEPLLVHRACLELRG